MKNKVVFIVCLLLAMGCATVPITGRKQLTLIPGSQMREMSFANYSTVISESKVSANEEWTAMVKNSGERISKAVEQYMTEKGLAGELKDYKWEFNLIDENTVNAWAMPGGKVAFYTGIMPICQNEVGVAVVMGHEVAHAIAKHGNERMTQGMAVQLGGAALSVALQDKPALTQNLFMQSYGIGSQLGILKYSRLHESEADRLGLTFMAMAGYDPREAPKFWERMAAQSSGGQAPPEFMSTHPSHDTRISDLNKWMAEALPYYKPGS